MRQNNRVEQLSVKNSPIRREVARQLLAIRQIERTAKFQVARDMDQYIKELLGLRAYFDYARSIQTSTTILDLGSGIARGISQIQDSLLGRGLLFKATGLAWSEDAITNMGNENFHVTSAEVLSGIEDNSVAGILASASIAYSASPLMVVRRMHAVLTPGGIIKASFRSTKQTKETLQSRRFFNKSGFKTPAPFVQALKEHNYDINIFDSGSRSVMVAIKPPTIGIRSAADLMEADLMTQPRSIVGPVFSDNQYSR